MQFDFERVFASRPVILAPMEEVSDAAFRRVCRARGADVCVTEFVRAESLVRNGPRELNKIELGPGDTPTAIQIYGADPACLSEAAEIAERAEPVYLDINCGCWVPRIARNGAGAGWLRCTRGDGGHGQARRRAGRTACDSQDAHRVGR